MDDRGGMTDEEARGFNRMFLMGFFGFTVVAAIAHMLAWQWRPWF